MYAYCKEASKTMISGATMPEVFGVKEVAKSWC